MQRQMVFCYDQESKDPNYTCEDILAYISLSGVLAIPPWDACCILASTSVSNIFSSISIRGVIFSAFTDLSL